ncbi:hypothetical protein CHARACLAT_030294 [Characodon lateralis]|uniref:Secreted protein n=1 Tax=Characodon lateralis TaxID=208331 RepID=A0ABU7DB91_9TELE|nr:hypothetical protein [Characodon lateralis]
MVDNVRAEMAVCIVFAASTLCFTFFRMSCILDSAQMSQFVEPAFQLLWCVQNDRDFSQFFASFVCCRSPDILAAICVANGRQCSAHSTPFTTSKRRSFYLLLAGFNLTWRTWILRIESRRFIYRKPNNAAVVAVSEESGEPRD